MNEMWKEFLNSSEFDEGKECFQKNSIHYIKRKGNRFTAVVRDGEDYSVTITPGHKTIIDMECTCDTAQNIGYCRHEAAYLLELTKRNSMDYYDFYPTVLKLEINQLNDRLADEKNFIPDDLIFLYADKFEVIVCNMVSYLIRKEEVMVAFETVKTAFMMLNDIQMEDESEQYDLAFMLEKNWDLIIHRASEHEKDVMYAWFVKMLPREKELICGESIPYIYYNSFDDPKYLMIQLDEIRKELENPEDVNYLWGTLNAYRNCLEGCHLGLDEYEKWLEEHDHINEVKKRRLDLLVEREDYKEAVNLVEYYRKKEITTPTGMKWEDTLLKLYQKTGDMDKEREILEDILLEREILNRSLMDELQRISSDEKWIQFMISYIQRFPNTGIKLFGDQLTDDGLLTVLEHTSKDIIDAYSLKLMDRYPEQFLRIYTKLVHQLVGQKGNKRIYEQIKDCLLKMEKLPKGREVVEKLIDNWESKYSHRHSMMKMLGEVENAIDYHPHKRTIEQGMLDLW